MRKMYRLDYMVHKDKHFKFFEAESVGQAKRMAYQLLQEIKKYNMGSQTLWEMGKEVPYLPTGNRGRKK